MNVLIIRTDETTEIVDVDVTLEWLHLIVGGYIEGFYGSPGWHGYCNEEGKLLGLSVNNLATGFARELGWNLSDVDFIVGNVVFLGDGGGGTEASVPSWLIDAFQLYLGG